MCLSYAENIGIFKNACPQEVHMVDIHNQCNWADKMLSAKYIIY